MVAENHSSRRREEDSLLHRDSSSESGICWWLFFRYCLESRVGHCFIADSEDKAVFDYEHALEKTGSAMLQFSNDQCLNFIIEDLNWSLILQGLAVSTIYFFWFVG